MYNGMERIIGEPLAVEVAPLRSFYIGEEYHQDYYNKTGDMPYCHIRTKKF